MYTNVMWQHRSFYSVYCATNDIYPFIANAYQASSMLTVRSSHASDMLSVICSKTPAYVSGLFVRTMGSIARSYPYHAPCRLRYL